MKTPQHTEAEDTEPQREGHLVPVGDALRYWARLGFINFGGPAGQIAIMHDELVDKKRWISNNRFLHALNYCMLLPGPEAQQLATYGGWMLHGWRGGLVAGGLFVFPGFLAILALSFLYAGFRDVAIVAAMFFGLKPAVLAIVLEAMVRIGHRALKNGFMLAIALSAFVAIFVFGISFPLIILAAALSGYVGQRVWEDRFLVIRQRGDGRDRIRPDRPSHQYAGSEQGGCRDSVRGDSDPAARSQPGLPRRRAGGHRAQPGGSRSSGMGGRVECR
jgi:chromate transporter